MFAGERINTTEDRAVLHTALRAPASERLDRRRPATSSPRCTRSSTGWPRSRCASATASGPGFTGKPIRNVVNIGIGGSDLGPAMATEALRALLATARARSGSCRTSTAPTSARPRSTSTPPRRCSSSASKTFTTLETLTNARTARDVAAVEARGDEAAVASTSSPCPPTPTRCASSASTPTNMFGFWDWVGGRYSMGSAIGLSLMIAIGPDDFRELLAGLPRDGRALPDGAARAQPARAHGPARRLVRRLLRRRDPRRPAVRQELAPLPGVPAAARDGVERQVGAARRRRRSTSTPARSCGARRAPTASTRTTSCSTRARRSCRSTSSASSTRPTDSASTTTC